MTVALSYWIITGVSSSFPASPWIWGRAKQNNSQGKELTLKQILSPWFIHRAPQLVTPRWLSVHVPTKALSEQKECAPTPPPQHTHTCLPLLLTPAFWDRHLSWSWCCLYVETSGGLWSSRKVSVFNIPRNVVCLGQCIEFKGNKTVGGGTKKQLKWRPLSGTSEGPPHGRADYHLLGRGALVQDHGCA